MVVTYLNPGKETITADSRKHFSSYDYIDKAKIDSTFDLCCGCNFNSEKMSSIPPGMFSARKIRENEEKMILSRITNAESHNSQKYFSTKLMELSPLKYNSKLMNSIWGLYNRYSPHNIKRTNDDLFETFGGLQESSASLSKPAALKDAANSMGKSPMKQSQNLPKIENIWSNLPISQSH